jgi:hypothetical protein
MVDTGLNSEGRNRARLKFRGISVSEYIPAVITAIENDEETIFHSDSGTLMSEPRGQSENRLLVSSW